MTEEHPSKRCFVIAPIGSLGSDTRRRSDQVLKYIISPALEPLGYQVTRADMISEPGIITQQIVQRVMDDELVVADLTGRNPNVFYELAVRHLIRKPVILIQQSGEDIPFDVNAARVIHFDHTDLDSAAECRDAIRAQADAIERDPNLVHSPISVAIDVTTLRQSDDPIAAGVAEILSRMQGLEAAIVRRDSTTAPKEPDPRIGWGYNAAIKVFTEMTNRLFDSNPRQVVISNDDIRELAGRAGVTPKMARDLLITRAFRSGFIVAEENSREEGQSLVFTRDHTQPTG